MKADQNIRREESVMKQAIWILIGVFLAIICAAGFWRIVFYVGASDAIRLQVKSVQGLANQLTSGGVQLPDGDVTKIFIGLGAFYVDPLESVIDRAAMERLEIDADSYTVKNEFGGDLKVMSKNQKVKVIYTMIPDGVCPVEAVCQ